MAAMTTTHRLSLQFRRSRGAATLLLAFMLAICIGQPNAYEAAAQDVISSQRGTLSPFLTFQQPPRPSAKSVSQKQTSDKNAQMLVQANEIQYDYNNERVAATGSVQIYYRGSTLEADKVIYDQKTKRLHAEGNARLTEANGKITYGDIIDLSDDFRDGFVDSLRVDTPDNTRIAATRAERSGGNFTVFHSSVYTACEPCKDDPKKPPLWQVKAARIIHNEQDKMIYFENARIEFFGLPLAYLPYFSAPDPTVKRKTGFLMPVMTSSNKYGVAVQAPYFWALAPDYDLTLLPTFTTRQGPLLEAEWRQRLTNGVYTVHAAGISQWDKEYFVHSDGTPTPGDRTFRGSIETAGQFNITDKWIWGWNGGLFSDKTFVQDYHIKNNQQNFNSSTSAQGNLGRTTESVSQIYLTGRGDRSFFDARTIYYYGFSEADAQKQLPIVHPVVDYSYTFGQPVFGGELGYRLNFTSLTRQEANFDPINQTAFLSGDCLSADSAAKTPTKCLLRGAPGTYSRFSAETNWRSKFIDPLGQVWTPFISLRADAAAMSIDNDATSSVGNFINTGDSGAIRVMPTVGVEYRYPFIAAQSWGTQTLEPIAQLVVRPNETSIGRLPNEDAQSLVFDDSNLFRVDKFSGWDRIEGGGRANVGLQYTAQFNRGGFFNALFGQSYHLFGTNSFAVADTANTGLGSGLDKTRSDYVARVSYQPDSTFSFTTRYRFDSDNFALHRFEAEGRAMFDRWQFSLLYGNYDAQPEIGFLNRREGILGSGSVKINANWVLFGAARYNIHAGQIDQTQIGTGYVDDCFILALNYIRNNVYSGNPQTDHRFMMQFSLRTLGGQAPGQNMATTGIP
jgi:LPS-assembly protein